MTTIELANDYHGTVARCRPRPDRAGHLTLSRDQVRRARRALCSSSTCACAQDEAGTHGLGGFTVFPVDYSGTAYYVYRVGGTIEGELR